MNGTQQPGPRLFESLPLEIRRQIYGYLLPHSVPQCHQLKNPVWRLGNIEILATNKQIHDEAVDLMYGDSWFFVNVNYDEITFKCNFARRDIWICGDYFSQAGKDFFEEIGPRNVSRIRHLQIYIILGPGVSPPIPECYQANIDSLAAQVSLLSNSLKPIQNFLDLRVTVRTEREEPDVRFEYALAKPLLELNSRRKFLLSGFFDSQVELEQW